MRIIQITLSTLLLTMSASAIAAFGDALPSSIAEAGDTPAKITLGNALYFDNRLSSDGTISCASCHVPGLGGDDGLPTSPGVGTNIGTRNAQTVLNAGLMSAQFWEGREPTLEAQAMGPFINPIEMGLTNHAELEAIVQGISGYQALFDNAFGAPATIDTTNIVDAIAAFERTLLTPNSPYDQFWAGNTAAMTADQVTGMNLFQSKNCTQCHTDVLLARQSSPGNPFLQLFPKFPLNTDFDTLNTALGAPGSAANLLTDLGRGAFTGNSADDNRWKVQSLRNIAETGPYFHNGAVATLDEAVKIMGTAQLDLELGTSLTQTEVDRIVDFLGALTGTLPSPTPVSVAHVPTSAAPVMSTGFALLMALVLSVAGIRRLS